MVCPMLQSEMLGEVNLFKFVLLACTPLHTEEICIATVVVAVAKQTKFAGLSRGLKDVLGILDFFLLPFKPPKHESRNTI